MTVAERRHEERQDVFASIVRAPMAISEDGLARLLQLAPQALQAKDGKPLQNARRATVRQGVAIIPVDGPLSRHESLISWFCGSSNYETIMRDLREALDSAEVTSVILDVDSPGGDAHGCGELAEAIYRARAMKDVCAYVSGMACSAAYYLAAACTKIVATPSAMVGCIGVRTTLVDESGMLEKFGVEVHEIASEQTPLKVVDPSKEADRERIRTQLSEMCEPFIKDVARYRGVSSARVQQGFGRGDSLVGKSALAAGMIDQLGDFESLLAEYANKGAPSAPAKRSRRASVALARKPNARTSSARSGTMAVDHQAMRTHLKAAHDIAHDESMEEEHRPAAVAPHLKAAHHAMGTESPFHPAHELYEEPDGDDDDDEHESKLRHKLAAITGKTDTAEIVATISAWKQSHAEVSDVKAQIARQKAEAARTEFDAALTEATLKGVIPPAEAHPRRAYAVSLREQGGVKALRAYVEALGGAPAPGAVEPRPAERQTSGQKVPADGQSKMLKSLGMKPEDFAAHAEKLRRMSNPVEE